MSMAEKLLLLLSRKPGTADYRNCSREWSVEGALAILRNAFPGFLQSIKGMDILDYGCGAGYQVISLANNGARHVLGIDQNYKALEKAQRLALETNVHDRVEFAEQLKEKHRNQFDFVISQNSMEHYPDPAAALEQMKSALKPNGQILITFGPPWFSPYGSHMHFFTKVPWVNLLFPEKVVMNVRKNFRQDGATRYEDVESGLNRMTVAKFGSILSGSGLKVVYQNYNCVKSIGVLGRIPVLRELFINQISCVLTRCSNIGKRPMGRTPCDGLP